MAYFELVGWRARDGEESQGAVKSLYHVCEIFQPTHGMTSPDEITALGSLPCCMASCPHLSCGFAISKCILGQSSYGCPSAMSGEKLFV